MIHLRLSPGLILAFSAIALALLSVVIVAVGGEGGWGPGFVYACLNSATGYSWSGYARGGVVYYDFIHSVHKTREIDLLVVTPDGFKPSRVYLSELGAGAPETIVGESQGFLVALPGASYSKPVLEVDGGSSQRVSMGGSSAWIYARECGVARLIAVP